MTKVVRSRLKETLSKRGMRLADLEKICSVSYQTLHAIYNNKTKQIKYETLNEICNALHCQVTGVIEYLPDDELEAEPAA